MPEPATTVTATGVATLAAQAVAVPFLSVAGVSLGIRADVLLAGFSGAVAALTLLNSVPATSDTLQELVRTSLKRVGVAVGSAVTAGYTAPLVSLFNNVPDGLLLSGAFVVGAGAMQMLPRLIDRLSPSKPGAKQEESKP